MNGERTQTPWTFYRDEDANVVAIVNDAPSLGKRRIIVRPGVGNSRSDAENNANAAFIVRACNAHDGLVTAVRELLDCYWGEGDGAPAPQFIKDAQAALKLAEAK